MYQDLIIPISYSPELYHDQSLSSTKFDTNNQLFETEKKNLSKKLKMLQELIDDKSSAKHNLAREALIQEYETLQKKLNNLSDSSMPNFKHRVEVHKIPITIKHRSKQELDNGIGLKNAKMTKPPSCIHYDTPKIGKINVTT